MRRKATASTATKDKLQSYEFLFAVLENLARFVVHEDRPLAAVQDKALNRAIRMICTIVAVRRPPVHHAAKLDLPGTAPTTQLSNQADCSGTRQRYFCQAQQETATTHDLCAMYQRIV